MRENQGSPPLSSRRHPPSHPESSISMLGRNKELVVILPQLSKNETAPQKRPPPFHNITGAAHSLRGSQDQCQMTPCMKRPLMKQHQIWSFHPYIPPIRGSVFEAIYKRSREKMNGVFHSIRLRALREGMLTRIRQLSREDSQGSRHEHDILPSWQIPEQC